MAYMAFTIFAADLLIMLVFRSFDESQPPDFLFLDPFVLACFLLPILYFFFLRPLITNLTNTKQTKQTLLHSFEKLENERRRLFSILDELPASVHLLRPDHKIVYRNRFFKERFGCDYNAPCYKVLHGEEEPCHVCHAFNVFKSGKGGETEELHTNDQIFKLYNYPFTDIDGSSLVLQLGIDLTKQKEYEKRLIQTEKLLTVAEMSAMISHEFRNSLTSVKMILELQNESQNLSPREKDSLSVVLSSINHMEEIVSQLINFSQPREKQFRRQNLNAILEECIRFTQVHLKKNNIVLEKHFNQNLPLILLDKHYIKEAIVNLILNAIQAISMTGKEEAENKIEIKTDICEWPESVQADISDEAMSSAIEDSIDWHTNEDAFPSGSSCIMIIIKDSGIGIKKGEIENIYNPFYTDKKQGGTGLGLAMVKRNINAHRGIVSVESEPQRGTVFKIYLPIASAKGEQQSP
jgi:signal transduction histidine kinase